MRGRLRAALEHRAEVEARIERENLPARRAATLRERADRRVERNRDLLDRTAGGQADLRARIAECEDEAERAELLRRLGAGEEAHERQLAAHRQERGDNDEGRVGADAPTGAGGTVGAGPGDGPGGGDNLGRGPGGPTAGPPGSRRAVGGGGGGCPGDDGRGPADGDPRRILIGGRQVVGRAQPEPARYEALRAAGRGAPQFYELEGEQAAEAFHAAISAHREENPHGGSVDVHEVAEYRSMRLFVTDDGRSGWAMNDGDELVSVFSAAGSGRGRAIAASAVAAGARRADCFAQPQPGWPGGDPEGMLPRMYRGAGLVEVARVAINPDYDHPADAKWVSILAVVDHPPEVRRFDENGYEAACRWRDRLIGHGEK